MKYPTLWLIALIAFGSWPVAVQGGDLDDGDVNIQEVIASLEANDLSADEIRAIDSYARIDVVDLSAFESSDEYQALESALRGTDNGWAMVQTAIVTNDAIKQELTRRSVAMRRVVAVTMDDADTIAIYLR